MWVLPETPACSMPSPGSIPGRQPPVSLLLPQLCTLFPSPPFPTPQMQQMKPTAELSIFPAAHSDVQSLLVQQSQPSLNCISVSASWICRLKLSQVVPHKRLFVQLKGSVCVLFFESLDSSGNPCWLGGTWFWTWWHSAGHKLLTQELLQLLFQKGSRAVRSLVSVICDYH